MLDQTEVKPTNGHTELPPRAMARSTSELLHDMATLAELQGKLALLDLREGFAKLIVPAGLAVVGAGVGLGCIPIGLMTLALSLEKLTNLTPPVCFAIAFGVGLLLAAILVIPALATLKTGVRTFDRSLEEWRRNRQWAKETLKRMARSGTSPTPRSAGSHY
jgi:Zn-dependent protease with chaperone function